MLSPVCRLNTPPDWAPTWYRSRASCFDRGCKVACSAFRRMDVPSSLASWSTGSPRATCNAGPRSPSTSLKASGPSFLSSDSSIAFSRACLKRTLNWYSASFATSPSYRGTPLLASVLQDSSWTVLNVCHRRQSTIDIATEAGL